MSTISEIMATRRQEIISQIKDLEVELAAIQAFLNSAQNRQGVLAILDPPSDVIKPPKKLKKRTIKNLRKKAALTIKQMVVKLIDQNGAGLSAIDLMARIKAVYDLEIPRSSLSPQLSRLKQEGRLVDKSGIWCLASDSGNGSGGLSPEDQEDCN